MPIVTLAPRNAIERQVFSNPDVRDALIADAIEHAERMIALQGDAALLCTREHAARHEAGHVVQHLAEGERVTSVEVFRRGPYWLGWTARPKTPWSITPNTDPAADLVRARVLLAGPFAEMLTSKKPALAAGADEIALARGIVENAARKLSTEFEPLMWANMAQVVENILRTHRRHLEALAAVLMIRPKVKGFELRRLIGKLNANSTPRQRR